MSSLISTPGRFTFIRSRTDSDGEIGDVSLEITPGGGTDGGVIITVTDELLWEHAEIAVPRAALRSLDKWLRQ